MLRRVVKKLLSIKPVAFENAPAFRMTTAGGRPNISDLWRATKDIEALKLSVKSLGYELARSMESKLQGLPIEPPGPVGVQSKPVTQGDIETRWFRGWCAELQERPRYHRSLWECAYILQALFDAGVLKPQAKLLSLAGEAGPLLSYLANRDTRQTLIGSNEAHCRENLVDQTKFNASVKTTPATLADLPASLNGFDACWSMGAVNLQGSIDRGVAMVLGSLETLKLGGVAVHMIDFNFANDDQTIDNWPHVLFQRRHIEQLASELRQRGHSVASLDFHVGHQPLDRFVDFPPFEIDQTKSFERLWRDGWQGAHLKVSINGFPATSFGLICQRRAD